MHTRLKLFFGSLLSLSAVACQAPASTGSAIPSSRLGDAPNLIKPDQTKLPEKLRQAILQRNGDPNLVKLDTLKNLKEKGFPGKEDKQNLNSHFGIAQSFPQVSCQSGNICSYEDIGDFGVFYNAIYGDYYESYNNGLCAYDQYFYCTQDPDNPDCIKSINELKFYGCACPDGYTQTDNGCAKQANLIITYNSNNNEPPPSGNLILSHLIQDNFQDELNIQIINDGINAWQFEILNNLDEIVYSVSGNQESTFTWNGIRSDGDFLSDGLYTIRLTSGNVVLTRNLELQNNPQLRIFHPDIPSDVLEPPVGEIMISPQDQDNRYDNLGITVTVSNNQSWQLNIQDANNAVVWQKNGMGSAPSLVWDGKNDQEQFLPDGSYRINLIVDGNTVSTLFRIKTNTEFIILDSQGGMPSAEGILISPANHDNQYDWVNFKVVADAALNWYLEILDSGGSIVWNKNGIGNRLEPWYGVNQTGSFLPDGNYTVRFNGENHVQNIKIKNDFKINVSDGNRPAGDPPSPEGIVISPANRDNRYDWANFEFSLSPSLNYRLEVIDFGGSTVWFKNGSGALLEKWYGTNQAGELLPEGTYSVKLTIEKKVSTATIKIRQDDHPSQVDIFMPSSAYQLINGPLRRMRIINRDIDILMRATQVDFPQSTPFQAQSIPNVAAFRIQQQQTEPPPPELSAYSESRQDDHLKVILDAKNDELVTNVELLKQKVNWMKQITQQALNQYEQNLANFTVQQIPSDSPPESDKSDDLRLRLEELLKIENSFDGLSASSGCYNYYNFKGTWKKKKNTCNSSIYLRNAILKEDLSLELSGEVINPPEACGQPAFNYQTLSPDFGGDLVVNSPAQIEVKNNQFVMHVTDYYASDAYIQNFKPAKAKVRGCFSQGCAVSNTEEVNLFPIEAESGIEETEDPGFSTQQIKPETVVKSPLKPSGNKIPLDGLIYIRADKYKAEVGSVDPSRVKGIMNLRIKNSREEEIFNSQRIRPFLPYQANSRSEVTTADGLYYVFRSRSIHVWDGKSNVGCPHGDNTSVVPAGRYTSLPFGELITIPAIKNGNILHNLPVVIKPINSYLRLSHVCDVGAQYYGSANNYYNSLKAIADKLRSDYPTGSGKDGIHANPEVTPITVIKYNLSNNQGNNIQGVIKAIPGAQTKIPETVKTPEEESRQRYFLDATRINTSGPRAGRPYAEFESEKKALEYLVHKIRAELSVGIRYNDSKTCDVNKSNKIKGTIELFVDKKTCEYCAEMSWQLREMLPNVDLIWMDGTKACY